MEKEQAAQRIGRNLFMLRRRAGLSQGEVGQMVGLAQANVSAIESGKTLPSMDKFIRLCRVLKARPDELLKGVL